MIKHLIIPLFFLSIGYTNKTNAQCNPNFATNLSGNTLFANALTNDSTMAHIWYFGDGTIAYGTITNHNYSAFGQYNVKHVIRNVDGTCYDSASIVFSIIDSNTICNLNPSFTTFVDSLNNKKIKFLPNPLGSNYVYTWHFGDGNSSILPTPSHTYLNFGTYNVQLIVKDTSITNCIDTTFQNITIGGAIDSCNLHASIFKEVNLNIPKTYNFIGGPPGANNIYSWDFGDGTFTTGAYVNKTFSNFGVYNIKLIVKDTVRNCIDSAFDTLNIVNNCLIVASFTKVVDSLNSKKVSFFPQLVNSSYLYSWDFGDGQTSNSISPIHIFLNGGIYNVKFHISDSSGNCKDSSTQSITISNGNTCGISAGFTYVKTNYINYSSVQFNPLTNVNSNLKYNWSFGNGSYSNLRNPVNVYNQVGIYVVKLIVTDTVLFCSEESTQFITISFNFGDTCSANFNYIDSLNYYKCTPYSNQAISSTQWTVYKLGAASAYLTSNLTAPTFHLADTGSYQICLVLTTSTGCVRTTCNYIYNTISGRTENTILKVFPNPVTSNITTVFNSEKNGVGVLKIMDLMGNIVFKKQVSFNIGVNQFNTVVSNFKKGTYLLTLQVGVNNKTLRFIKF